MLRGCGVNRDRIAQGTEIQNDVLAAATVLQYYSTVQQSLTQ